MPLPLTGGMPARSRPTPKDGVGRWGRDATPPRRLPCCFLHLSAGEPRPAPPPGLPPASALLPLSAFGCAGLRPALSGPLHSASTHTLTATGRRGGAGRGPGDGSAGDSGGGLGPMAWPGPWDAMCRQPALALLALLALRALPPRGVRCSEGASKGRTRSGLGRTGPATGVLFEMILFPRRRAWRRRRKCAAQPKGDFTCKNILTRYYSIITDYYKFFHRSLL